VGEELEKRADFEAFLCRVTEAGVWVDPVMVASALPFAFDVAGLDEVGEDALGGPFGDTNAVSDLSQGDVRVGCDAEQDLRVVREEAPVGGVLAT
jgi:hypothetical protein